MTEHSSAGDAIPEHAGIIEVRVRDLSQLFDSMDPSPFRERDLDRDFEEYVVDSALELRSATPVALVVQVEGAAALAEAEPVGDAIRQHFARRAERTRHELRQLLRRGWTSLAIGLSFLAAALGGGASVARWMPAGTLATVLSESVLIGGWVAMWRPMEIFLYDWWEIRGRRRLYERLARLPVRLVATGEGQPDADYRIDPETVERPEHGGASAHLVAVRAAIDEPPAGIEVVFQPAGDSRPELRKRRVPEGSAGARSGGGAGG